MINKLDTQSDGSGSAAGNAASSREKQALIAEIMRLADSLNPHELRELYHLSLRLKMRNDED